MKATDPPIADPLAKLRAANPRIRTGVGGWTFAPWRGAFYPDRLPQRRELEYASRHLAAIEINGTYYRAQKPAVYAKWRDETPDGFVFSLKAPRYVAEHARLADAGNAVTGFVSGGLAEFGDRLGPILWQFPPSRRFERDDFAAFLDLLTPTLEGTPLRHVIEVRNESFLCTEYLDLARAHRVANVFTDSADYPSFADVTGDFVYARLMRSKASIETGYTAQALDAWAARARLWADGAEPDDLPRVQAPIAQESGARPSPRDVFLYFISAAKQRNPAAAIALQRRVG
jgi:uncharacterized protein YecE (DUF72 family)